MQKVSVSLPQVTQDEALEHVVHHLCLAACFFEAIPEERDETTAEFERLVREQEIPLEPAMAWFFTQHVYYEQLRARPDD